MDEVAATQFLVDYLQQVLKEHATLISNVDDQVEELEKDLSQLKARLSRDDNSASFRRKNATVLRDVNWHIRRIVYEIEDEIDRMIIPTSKIPTSKIPNSNTLIRFLSGPPSFVKNISKKFKHEGDLSTEAVEPETQKASKIHVKNISAESSRAVAGPLRVKELVEAIRKKIKDVENSSTNAEEAEIQQLEQVIKKPRESNAMVGFEGEKERIINRVKEETEELDVITIIGLPGLGKTTLAYKIFTDPDIKSRFSQPAQRIWVNVSHEYRKKDMLLSILSNFINITDKMRLRTDDDICQMIREHLQELHRFLIVLDDVYSVAAWTDLKGAFPEAHKAGKILITTQREEVACCSDFTRDPVRLCLLTFKDSWKLLQLEVFDDSPCPPKLETYGRLIAKKCGGLPLLIVVIGKVLRRKLEEQYWEQVSGNFSSHLEVEDFSHNNVSFYDLLPYQLKQCFLYMGLFPEGLEIPVRTLKRLWIAEGFIPGTAGIPLEKKADKYLKELINRNLVMVTKRGRDGKIKTCRLHYMLRQFCKKEASSERQNLFQEMKYTVGNGFEPSLTDQKKHRRLGINSSVNSFFSSHTSCLLVRSFLCFSQEELDRETISSIPRVLKFLRVFEAKPMTFRVLPGEWDELALLRYVVLSIDFEVIPKDISNLQYLQTLIIHTTSPTLEIKANIWTMRKLRHVETNVSTKLPRPKQGEKGMHLEMLGMVSDESCEEVLFDRLCNLRKLGIRGQLDASWKAKGLNKLQKLENLKLENDLYASSTSHGKLERLPRVYEFPPNLRSLSLCATKLDWNEMSVLRALNNLKILKLKDNAFQGVSWEETPGGFSQLQVLHIECCDLMTWTAPENPFPTLQCLILAKCERLEEIPLSLKDSLQKLHLEGVSDSVLASALRIKQDTERVPFELCIASGDE